MFCLNLHRKAFSSLRKAAVMVLYVYFVYIFQVVPI